MNRKEKDDEKILIEQKQNEAREVKLKIKKADTFRRNQLLARLGWSPWQRLLNRQRYPQFDRI